jgi:hypothetical protein
LPNGDLLCVFRRLNPDRGSGQIEVRWQGALRKSGDTWIAGEIAAAPLPHSGHPELLSTREGPILHVATTGVHATSDAGQTWHKLDVPGSAYYPRSVQAADGRIFVFGHVGGDDAYGKVDQSIVMDSFRLVRRDIETKNPGARLPGDGVHAIGSVGLLRRHGDDVLPAKAELSSEFTMFYVEPPPPSPSQILVFLGS